MLKETPKSLRTYFGLLAGLMLVSAAGSFSQIALVKIEEPDAELSLIFLVHALFRLGFGLLFAYITFKFRSLITERPSFIKTSLHTNFAAGILIAIISLYSVGTLNAIGVVISIAIYFYLLRSVDRISKELIGEKLPNQSPQTRSTSGPV